MADYSRVAQVLLEAVDRSKGPTEEFLKRMAQVDDATKKTHTAKFGATDGVSPVTDKILSAFNQLNTIAGRQVIDIRAVDNASKQVMSAVNAFSQLNTVTNANVNAMTNSGKAAQTVQSTLAAYGAGVEGAATTTGELTGASGALTASFVAGAAVTAAFAVVVAGLALDMTEGVKAAREWQGQMESIQNTLQATDEQTKAFGDHLLEVALKNNVSAGGLAKTEEQLIQLGLASKDNTELLDKYATQINDYADVMHIPGEQAAGMITKAMTIYSVKSPEQLSQFLSAVSTMKAGGGGDYTDIFSQLTAGRLSPAAMGMNPQDVMTLVLSGKQAGITWPGQLKSMMQDITEKSQTNDPMGELIREIETTRGLDVKTRRSYLEAKYSSGTATTILSLANAELVNMKKNQEDISREWEKGTRAQDEYNGHLKTIDGQMEKLTDNFKTNMIKAGNRILPVIIDIITAINRLEPVFEKIGWFFDQAIIEPFIQGYKLIRDMVDWLNSIGMEKLLVSLGIITPGEGNTETETQTGANLAKTEVGKANLETARILSLWHLGPVPKIVTILESIEGILGIISGGALFGTKGNELLDFLSKGGITKTLSGETVKPETPASEISAENPISEWIKKWFEDHPIDWKSFLNADSLTENIKKVTDAFALLFPQLGGAVRAVAGFSESVLSFWTWLADKGLVGKPPEEIGQLIKQFGTENTAQNPDLANYQLGQSNLMVPFEQNIGLLPHKMITASESYFDKSGKYVDGTYILELLRKAKNDKEKNAIYEEYGLVLPSTPSATRATPTPSTNIPRQVTTSPTPLSRPQASIAESLGISSQATNEVISPSGKMPGLSTIISYDHPLMPLEKGGEIERSGFVYGHEGEPFIPAEVSRSSRLQEVLEDIAHGSGNTLGGSGGRSISVTNHNYASFYMTQTPLNMDELYAAFAEWMDDYVRRESGY